MVLFSERLRDPPSAGPDPTRTLWDWVEPGGKPDPAPGSPAAAGQTAGTKLLRPKQQQQLLFVNTLTLFQNHGSEVLSAVEKKGHEEQRKRKQEGEELKEAMKVSLSEGWSLLLRLMKRRLQVLMLAADFHRLADDVSLTLSKHSSVSSYIYCKHQCLICLQCFDVRLQ